MARRDSESARPPRQGLSELDAYLIDLIRSNPKSRFGRIVARAQEARGIPRATAARHLSRLVRWGDVTLLPDRTYVVAEPDTPGARAVLELRWYDVTVVIRPNGNARIISEEELRVTAGRLDHIEFNHPKPPSEFIVWTSIPGKISQVPASHSASGLPVHRVDFFAPLTARESTWQRVCVSVEWPSWFRMATPSAPGSSRGKPDESLEFQSIEIASLGRRFERRLTPDALLRLQVVLPQGYPVGRVSCRVRLHAEPDRVDALEEKRIAQLTKNKTHQDGLRRGTNTLTLTIPKPIEDRHYTIEWRLPTQAQRAAWLGRLDRRLAS